MFTRERAEGAESAQIIVRPHTGLHSRSLSLSPLYLYVFLALRSRGSLTSRDMRPAGLCGIPKLGEDSSSPSVTVSSQAALAGSH